MIGFGNQNITNNTNDGLAIISELLIKLFFNEKLNNYSCY